MAQVVMERMLAGVATRRHVDLLAQVVMGRMLAGVATRRHVDVAEPVSRTVKARSTSKSAAPLRFVQATEAAMAELLACDLSDLDVAVLMIDGVHFADDWLVVAILIASDGTKIPVGLAHGDNENSTVVKGVLTDLVARGLNADNGLLVVLDRSKALRKASTRCTARRYWCSVARFTNAGT